MNAAPEYLTARLRLRQWSAADREPFAALNADPRVMEFLGGPLSREQSDAVAGRIETNIAGRGFGLWAVQTRATAEFIGFVGLSVTPPTLPFSPSVEVGWRLAFDHWGRGYATEAAREAVRNQRSRAVMERIGMHESGTFEHPLVADSALRLHWLYRLGREAHDR